MRTKQKWVWFLRFSDSGHTKLLGNSHWYLFQGGNLNEMPRLLQIWMNAKVKMSSWCKVSSPWTLKIPKLGLISVLELIGFREASLGWLISQEIKTDCQLINLPWEIQLAWELGYCLSSSDHHVLSLKAI